MMINVVCIFFFFSSRRRHTRCLSDWSSDVCSSDLREIDMFKATLLVLLPGLAIAHHGGSEYDMRQTIEFKAKLTRIDLINPHSWIYFDVTEPDGKISHHRCEMRSVHVLRRSGWSKEMFPVGQQITIEASPNRTDRASCYLQTILLADGTRMDRYGQYVKAPQGT